MIPHIHTQDIHLGLVKRFLVGFLLFGLISCSSVQVSSEKSPGANLSRYKTYSWAPLIKAQDTVLDQNIQAALDTALQRNGFIRASENRPADFQVSYSVSTRQEVVVNPGPVGPYWGGYMDSYAPVETFEEGSLVVDFIDTDSDTPFWRGVATADIDSQDQMFDEIPTATKKIVAEYRDDQRATA